MTDSSGAPDSEPRKSLGGHVRTHAKPLLGVAFASGIGILASFAFQFVTLRYLSPADFGLLAAFFVIVNVAAIGSASLQSAVAVQTAAVMPETPRRRGLRAKIPVEALTLGVGGGAVVALLSGWLAAALGTTPLVIMAAAASIPLSFVFADAVGLLQGIGRVGAAVRWSTLSQASRVVFAVLGIVLATGLGGMIGAVLAALVFAVLGALWTSRRIPRPATGVFSASGLTIVALTVSFAWLTNSDSFFLRAGAPEQMAGLYAAALVFVKTGFLLPTTLSLYLLPRFVRNRENAALSRLGVWVTLGLSGGTGLAMILFFALFGRWLLAFLAPSSIDAAIYLVPAAIAYLPWIAAQGMLIKMTSIASGSAALLLVVAIFAQAVSFLLVIPDITAMLILFGAIGVAVLAGFMLLDFRAARRSLES